MTKIHKKGFHFSGNKKDSVFRVISESLYVNDRVRIWFLLSPQIVVRWVGRTPVSDLTAPVSISGWC